MVQAAPQNGTPAASAAESPLAGARSDQPLRGEPSTSGSPSGSPALRGSAGAEPLRQADTLSQRDKELLSALANPSNDADAVLATLQPEEVGPWLERPEIQSAIAAAFELREIRLRFKLTAATDRAIDRMTAVFDANKDLSNELQRGETRRAANAIFRLSARLLGTPGAAPTNSGPSAPSPRNSFFRSSLLRHTNSSSSSVPSVNSVVKPSSPPETPPLDTTTPAAAIAGVVAAFRQLPSDAPRAALKLVERAIAEPIREQPVYKERFLSHLAASPALTHRICPVTADPIKIEGATATQRIIYTLEDGTKAAAFFRAVCKEPDTFGRFPTPSWLIDCIHPVDTS